MEKQKEELSRQLGLDMAAKFGVTPDEIFSSADLRAGTSSSGSAETEKPPPPHQQQQQQPVQTEALNLSSRERNRLKRSISKQVGAATKAKKRKKAVELYKADKGRLGRGGWAFKDFGAFLARDLFNDSWEIRHGAATALRYEAQTIYSFN